MPIADLMIFAKAPVAGRVKTRLAAVVGADAALQFYRETLQLVLARLRGNDGWHLEIAVTPDEAVKDDGLWPDGIPRRMQGGGDIGSRMERVLRAACPDRPIIIVGSDIPELEARHVERACQALSRHDLVFGPARDGGFWLIGSRRPLPVGCFEGVRWSTEHALVDSLRRIQGMTTFLVETLEDVDDHASYRRYMERQGVTRSA